MSGDWHVCDHRCVCPVHRTMLIYWPKGDDHAWDSVMYACLENPVALPTDEDDFDEDDMPEVPRRGASSGLTLGPPIK